MVVTAARVSLKVRSAEPRVDRSPYLVERLTFLEATVGESCLTLTDSTAHRHAGRVVTR